MKTIEQFKQENPAYADVPNEKLAARLYDKYYSKDMKFDDFLSKTLPPVQKEGNFMQKLQGQGVTGLHTLGEAMIGLGEGVAMDVRAMVHMGIAASEKMFDKKMSPEELLAVDDILQKPERWLAKQRETHQEGQQAIFDKHPEWKYSPPDSFKELVSSPADMALSAAGSIPVMAAAGILMYAKQPQASLALLYATEGQQAFNEAIDAGATKEEAEQSRLIYGSVSAGIEQLQLKHLGTLAPSVYKALLGRVSQKAVATGLKAVSMQFIKTAAAESIEEMLQGTWQEATAKMVYGKEVSGGWKGFVDRRAREGLIAGVLTLGTAGAASAAGISVRASKSKADAKAGKPVEQAEGKKPTEQAIDKLVGEHEAVTKMRETLAPAEVTKSKGHKGYQSIGAFTGSKSPLKMSKNWAILTAENPGNQTADPQQNADSNANMIEDIKKMGYDPIPVQGKYGGPVENSFLVPNMKPTDALKLGKKYGQESVLTPEGLVYQDGTVNPADLGNINFSADQADYYSTINIKGKDVKFSVPINFDTKKQTTVKADKAQKSRAHILAAQLNLPDSKRRNVNKAFGENASMRDMNFAQGNNVITALEDMIRKTGQKPLEETDLVSYMTETIRNRHKIADKPEIKGLEQRGIRNLVKTIKDKVLGGYHYGQIRVERLLEQLDGYEDGPNRQFIWEATRRADDETNVSINIKHDELVNTVHKTFNNDARAVQNFMTAKPETIEGVRSPISPVEKVGVYINSLNENQLRHLVEGNGFTENEVASIVNNLTPQEKAIGDWMLDQYNKQYDRLAEAHMLATGQELAKENFYAAIKILDNADVNIETDFLSELADDYKAEIFGPEKGVTKKRKGATQAIVLDPFSNYFHNASRVERYIAFSSLAQDVGRVLNNPKWKSAVNDVTNGHGSEIIKRWFGDTVRGFNKSQTNWITKVAQTARRNGITYAIGGKVSSMMRAHLSLYNAVAADPKMLEHVPLNLARMMEPGGFQKIKDFVYSKSKEMQIRHFDRYQNSLNKLKGSKKRIMRKKGYSDIVMGGYKFIDLRTTLLAWKSLYDVASDKGMGDVEATSYADKWTGRTQPMGRVKDLPHFFRGSELEKLISTFSNQVNNNYNLWAHDIIGARKAGAINNRQVAYRALFSYVVPAMVYGMIGRFRPPKSWGEVGVDLLTYPVASLLLFGRIVSGIMQGYGYGTVATISIEEAGKALKAKGAGKKIMHGAKAIAAATGKVPHQAFITGEGMYDIATGETRDPRRLLYTEWALTQGKKDDEEVPIQEGSVH